MAGFPSLTWLYTEYVASSLSIHPLTDTHGKYETSHHVYLYFNNEFIHTKKIYNAPIGSLLHPYLPKLVKTKI